MSCAKPELHSSKDTADQCDNPKHDEICEECLHGMDMHSDADCSTCQECNIQKGEDAYDASKEEPDYMALAKDENI